MILPRLQDEINKPYYFFRPKQVFLRIMRKLTRHEPDAAGEQVLLPWGLPIRIRPYDMIGSAIFRTGVYDLCVTEVLWRLLDEAETAVDAGANIGQMTSIMAKRVADKGRVLSFEPHPQIFQELAANVAIWQTLPNAGKIETYEMGLSNETGVANLHTTFEFVQNRGTASLETDRENMAQESVTDFVSIDQLENIIESNINIGVMKLDVEGHELALLEGSSRLLTAHRIRDIVFEEKNYYPSPVTDLLEQVGYKIFSIEQGPLAIRVLPATRDSSHYKYEAQSYLATLNVSRALKRLRKWGYQCLRTEESKEIKLLPCVVVGLTLSFVVWLISNRDRER